MKELPSFLKVQASPFLPNGAHYCTLEEALMIEPRKQRMPPEIRQEQILTMLKTGGKFAPQIARQIGITADAVRNIMREMVRDGTLQSMLATNQAGHHETQYWLKGECPGLPRQKVVQAAPAKFKRTDPLMIALYGE